MDYSGRIKKIRNYFSMNQKEFAVLLNTARTALSELESGSREPSKDFILALSNIGVSIDWFLTGKGQPLSSEVMKFLRNVNFTKKTLLDIEEIKEKINKLKNEPIGDSDERSKSSFNSLKNSLPNSPDGVTMEAAPDTGGVPGSTGLGKEHMTAVLERAKTDRRMVGEIPLIYAGDEQLKKGVIIPFLEDQAVSAGYGADLDEGDNPSRYLQAPGYLAKYPDLAMLPVRGDSMDPTLHDGDMVVCDGGGWDGDGIYVIKSEEKAFVKRVLHNSKGYQVISDNKMYPSYGESNEDITIVGKVRAAVISVPGRRGGI